MNLPKTKKLNILLIGCGQVGTEIAKKLIEKQYVNRLFLYDKTESVCVALKRKLKLTKAQIVDSLGEVKNIDYTIIIISNIRPEIRRKNALKCASSYDARHKELNANIKSIKSILGSLKKLKSRIVVITNPVDEITNFLIKKLHSKNVIGFGFELDVLRYRKILNKKVLCIGVHGKSIPIVNFKTAEEYDCVYKISDENLRKNVKKSGLPYRVAGKTFEKFFDGLIGNKEKILMFSHFLTKPFLGVKNIAVSAPFKVKAGKIIGPANLKVNNIEKEKFIKIIDRLKKNIKKIS